MLAGVFADSSRAGPLRVGIDIDGEPMTFVDSKGVPSGFAVEIMNGIALELGFEVTYVPKHWPEMLADFQAGQTDALANITYTVQRSAFIDFSVPHIVMNGAIFVRKGDHSIGSLSDLRDHRVAVKPGGAPYEYLVAHGWAQHVVPTATLRDSLRAVIEGRADAALDARIMGLKNIRDEHLTHLEAADVAVTDFAQQLHIGLHPGKSADIARINEGLARLHANGTYDRIYEKWIDPLDPRGLRLRDLRPYLFPAALGLAMIIGAFLWQRRLLRHLARQAEALRLSEEQLTLVLEGSEDGFWDWDLRTGRIERSKRWAAMLGYTPAEIEPTFDGGMKLVHPDDRRTSESFQSLRGASETGRYNIEYRMQTKSGEWRWILGRCKVVTRAPDGIPLRIAGTHTDITDRKLLEEEQEKLNLKMLETQKLESLGVLAGGIAHDFNNLLTVIIANASLLRTENDNIGERASQLADIETAGHRAADLCRQMLAYAGKGQFVVSQVDVGGLVRETIDLLRVSVSKKAHLILNLTPSQLAIEADASQIQQVVMNLVINASDALGDGAGEIRLTTRRGRPEPVPHGVAHFFDLPEGECACLEVSDTGRGMDPGTLARIFDPFFTTKFTGRGLGLAAVLGIIRTCRGALTVESSPSRGTIFRLFLPLAPTTPPASSALPTPSNEQSRRGTILVVDDEPTVLATVKLLLGNLGYPVVTATDGQEAVDQFRAAPEGFMAVLLDLTMPRLNGAEALREIRRLNSSVPVLVMSGFSEQDVLNRLKGLGPVEILHKPFNREAFITRLTRITAR